MLQVLLEVRNVTKKYSGIEAVTNVSFSLEAGETLGYLGPNGSGKTTTISIIVGLLQPSYGKVYFCGRDIHEQMAEYRQRVGYVPEISYLYNFLTGEEYLHMVGSLRNMNATVIKERASELLRLFSLWDHRLSSIASYSKGMKQRLLIATALLHNPELLVFDEPLSGLDVTSTLVFKGLIRELQLAGKAILYSSHQLEIVERLCNSVIILKNGSILAHDSIDNLRSLRSKPSLEDVFAELVVQEDTDSIAKAIVQTITA
jgi:ABC-2 type transport system ATP-binding protein